jgi:hypothetical protein
MVEPLRRELAGLLSARDEVLGWRVSGGGGSRPVHSDPTAAEAEGRIGELGALIRDAQARIDATEGIVGDALRVIERMRSRLGARHADAVELYYIDRAPTWSDVASEMGVSASTLYRLREQAYAWVEERCKIA